MSTAPTNGSKKAISSFFAKNKAKRTDNSVHNNHNSSLTNPSTLGGTDGLLLTQGGSGGTTTSSSMANVFKFSEFSSLLGDGTEGGWVAETPEEEQTVVEPMLSSFAQQLKIVEVSDDMDDMDNDDNENASSSSSNVGGSALVTGKLSYADSAHKKLDGETPSASSSNGSSSTADTTTPTTTTSTVAKSWDSARQEARRQAEKANAGDWADANPVSKLTKGPNVNSINDFPTLPGQQVPETVSGIKKTKNLADLGSANRFGAFGDDDEDEDVPAVRSSTTSSSSNNVPTNNNVYRPPIGGRSLGNPSNSSSSSSGGKSVTSTVTPTGLTEGTGEVLSSSDQVKDMTNNILRELQSSSDTVEALRRFLEMNTQPSSLRTKAVEELLRFAMEETSKMTERMQLGKILLSFVPARFVTIEMLHLGVGRFSYLFDDLRLDAGKDAVRDVAQVLGNGVVEATLKNTSSTSLVNMTPTLIHPSFAIQNEGYVPITYVNPIIAKEISVQNNNKLDRLLSKAGTLAPKDDSNTASLSTSSSSTVVPKEDTPKPTIDATLSRVPSSMSTNSLVTTGVSTPSVNTPLDDDEDEFVTVSSKKKKKKGGKGKSMVEDE